MVSYFCVICQIILWYHNICNYIFCSCFSVVNLYWSFIRNLLMMCFALILVVVLCETSYFFLVGGS